MPSSNAHDAAKHEQNDGTAITPEKFRRIRATFEAALELSEAERPAYIAEACGNNAQMIAEVRRMLTADADDCPLLDACSDRSETFKPGETFASQYLIMGLLGRGGMGEVYRCRDTDLGREVALKVVSPASTLSMDHLARFQREARALAALNHPNIAAIYSTVEVEGVQALVLELVDGITLADRIAVGPIPVAEALSIARQIADALEAAHEAGIVHRDLKPSNVKLRPDGTVKVLDFGLAKDWRVADVVNHGDAAQTASAALNQTQGLLGTPGYMAPEQVRGEPLDRRADIWAFGVVLYEMLAGEPPFKGENIAEVLAAVREAQIDWDRIPGKTSPEVRGLVERCLDRNVRRRLRDIGEARVLLENVAAEPAQVVGHARTARVLSVVLAGGLLLFCAVWLAKEPERPRVATRLSIPMFDGQTLLPNRRSIGVSPDGRRIVYATPSGLRLRDLSAPESAPIRGTETFFIITYPAFSPDGKWIVFHTVSDQTIRKIPVEGGVALKICEAEHPSSLTWAPEGILFVEPGSLEVAVARTADERRRDGILLVSSDGGQPKHLVRMRGQESIHGVQLLPGGRHLLFTLAEGSGPDAWDRARIVVQNLATGERKQVLQGGSDARYLPTGHLVYMFSGSLFAVPFDLESFAVTGASLPAVEGVLRAAPESTGGAHYLVANNGTLLYVPGPVSPGGEIVISDRAGKREKLHLRPGLYETPRVSPNGREIAFSAHESGQSSIFVYELSGQTAVRRLTLQGNSRLPVWSSDSKRIAYQSDREGDRGIFWQQADGSGPTVRLTSAGPDESHEPEAWSSLNQVLLFGSRKRGEVTLHALSLRDRTVTAMRDVRSSRPIGSAFSSDGRWLAYAMTDKGSTTIWVRPFPFTGAKYEFVSEDGSQPNHQQWSPDGRELYYNPGPGEFKAIRIVRVPSFGFGKATPIPRPFGPANTLKPRAYDVMPDGRFVGVLPPSASKELGANQIVIVLDWFDELRARVPVVR